MNDLVAFNRNNLIPSVMTDKKKLWVTIKGFEVPKQHCDRTWVCHVKIFSFLV